MIFAYSELGRIAEHHVANKALDSKGAEGAISEIWTEVQHAGFPFFGLSTTVVYVFITFLVLAFVAYSIAGKGRGSHAGREEPRRAYRRELARQMARDDAKKIIAGEDPRAVKKRRRWMQW
jgi:hypothetical protein